MVFVKVGRTLANLLPFFEEATKCFDVSRAYDIVYLDFQKAFDKVPHDKLIIKMRTVGITGAITGRVLKWLQDRIHRVVLGGTLFEQGIVGQCSPTGISAGAIALPDLHQLS